MIWFAIIFSQLFDWVQYMKHSGRLLNVNVDTGENTSLKEKSPKQYQLTKQEREDLVCCGAFSLDEESTLDVKQSFSMEKQLHGKKCVWKSFTLDDGVVVSSVVNITCRSSTQIGRISHFLTLHDQISGKESDFATVKLFKSCKQDPESLLHYTDITSFDIRTVALHCLSCPLVTAADDQNESLLWLLNI